MNLFFIEIFHTIFNSFFLLFQLIYFKILYCHVFHFLLLIFFHFFGPFLTQYRDQTRYSCFHINSICHWNGSSGIRTRFNIKFTTGNCSNCATKCHWSYHVTKWFDKNHEKCCLWHFSWRRWFLLHGKFMRKESRDGKSHLWKYFMFCIVT